MLRLVRPPIAPPRPYREMRLILTVRVESDVGGCILESVATPQLRAVKPVEAGAVVRAGIADDIAAWCSSMDRRGLDGKYIRQGRKIIEGLGAKAPEAISPDAIEVYLSELDGSGATLNRHLGYISAFLSWCCRTERVKENAADRVQRARALPEHGNRAFSPAESAAVIEAARADLAAPRPRYGAKHRDVLYMVAWHSGLRRKELRMLEVREVRLGDRPPRLVLRPRTAKARKEQTVPLHPDVAAALRILLEGKPPNARVFPFVHDRVVTGDMRAAGIDFSRGRVGLHSFRKGLATDLARRGVPEAIAQHLLRHSDPKLTRGAYTDARLLPLAEAVDGVAAVAGLGRVIHTGADFENPLDKGRVIADTGISHDPMYTTCTSQTDRKTPGRLASGIVTVSKAERPESSGLRAKNLPPRKGRQVGKVAGAGFEPASAPITDLLTAAARFLNAATDALERGGQGATHDQAG
jgi:integrase